MACETALSAAHEDADLQDVLAFVLSSPTAPAGARAVTEIHHLWGNVLLDTQRFDAEDVVIGSASAHRWRFLGVDMGFVPTPVALALPWITPGWSDVARERRAGFVVPTDLLPDDEDLTLVEAGAGSTPDCVRVPAGWDAVAQVNGESLDLGALSARGLALPALEGGYRIPLRDGTRVVVQGAGARFVAARVPRGAAIPSRGGDVDWGFLSLMSFGGFVFLAVMLGMFLAPPIHQTNTLAVDERVVSFLLEAPEAPLAPKSDKTDEGRKAAKPEGKAGSKKADRSTAKAETREVKRLQLDRQIAERAGVLGATGGLLDQVLGSAALSDDLARGAGNLIGAQGNAIGNGGLGGRGPGIGGGGDYDGMGGVSTRGDGWGCGVDTKCDGSFTGKRTGEIGVVDGNPIVLGSLDRSQIDEVIKRQIDAIRYCYSRELPKNPALAGKVVVKFSIARNGSVSSAKVPTTTMHAEAVENCIVGRFMRMQFPEPKGGGLVVVSYPFLFEAS